MTHPSKRKGNRFEREIVAAFEAAGLDAERAWGSNGKHLTTAAGKACTADVDVLVEGSLKVQAKRRKAVAQYLKPPAGAHLTIIREDRGKALAIVPLSLLTRMLASIYHQPTTASPRKGEASRKTPPGGAARTAENPL